MVTFPIDVRKVEIASNYDIMDVYLFFPNFHIDRSSYSCYWLCCYYPVVVSFKLWLLLVIPCNRTYCPGRHNEMSWFVWSLLCHAPEHNVYGFIRKCHCLSDGLKCPICPVFESIAIH